MKIKFTSEKCPACESGEWQPKSDEKYVFRLGRKMHQVTGLHYAICNECGTRGYLPGQRKANRALINKYQQTLLGYVSPSDVLAVREKYLLTQKQANEIFGGGSQGFSKWERGITNPAGPTARLIKVALKYPEVMRDLAKEAGITIESSIAPPRVSEVFVLRLKTIEQTSSECDDNFANNGTSYDVEQDDYSWPPAEKTKYKVQQSLH